MKGLDYTFDSLASIVDGKLLQLGNQSEFDHLFIDSRNTVNPVNALFFAIEGERNNGHNYIAELYKKGIRGFVVNRNFQTGPFPEGTFVQVENVLLALQQLATHHRSRFNIPVIGITGSNGKTVVKEWIYQLLRSDYNIIRSPKSYNSQVGVPLSVLQMNEAHQLAIFEAGISQSGEMEILQKIVQPTIGVITNIGEAHSKGFHNRKEKASEKMHLFQTSETLIFSDQYEEIIAASANLNVDQKLIWGEGEKATVKAEQITTDSTSSSIQISGHNFNIPFTDKASVENAIQCIVLLLYLEIDVSTINERLKNLAPIAMRLELLQGINNCTIINDSYNSDLGSLEIALDVVNQQRQHASKMVIISDILQDKTSNAQLYGSVSELINQKNIDRVIGIGPVISEYAPLFNEKSSFYSSTEAFLEDFPTQKLNNSTILLKGARKFSFEKIALRLQEKAHETVLEIDLNAMRHNLNYYRKKLLKPETKVMAMVKAFGYGSGSHEVVNMLAFNRVDYLAVAYADEGVALRKAGIQLPIMVMNPETSSFDAMIRFDLEPEIYSLSILDKFIRSLIDQKKKDYPIHIKLETGMNRLGFGLDEVRFLIDQVLAQPEVKVKSIFSHLAASDDPQHDEFTLQQIEQFKATARSVEEALTYPVIKHILNTAGISRFPNAQLDMVRLGIGLYGIASHLDDQPQLQNVSTFKTVISQIKTVEPGESIGYGRTAMPESTIKIAVLPVGYADGFNRRWSNGKGKVNINGHLAPVIGNVCMDMCMVNVTEIPCNEGDEVELFGNQISILSLAQNLDTIPYEVLTCISNRVKRVYYEK
jgi:alanine racemase